MSVAGLIMQQLCMNKFVSPTTGATISSAQFGVLLALLFWPGSTLWGLGFVRFRHGNPWNLDFCMVHPACPV